MEEEYQRVIEECQRVIEDYKRVIVDKKLQAERLMNNKQVIICNIAIHTASLVSGASGAIPIPVADAVPITASQVTMVIFLGKVFNEKVTKTIAEGLFSAAASTIVGRSLVKLIPIIGWEISAAVAACVTEAIGWTIAVHFAKGAKSRWEKGHKASEVPSENRTGEENDTGISEEFMATLAARAEEFLSGEKKRSENEDEFSALLSDFEKTLDSLPHSHPLCETYDNLSLIID